MALEQTYPVHVLRDHMTALEAALSVCLADPGHKPVHRLRTETRRVEAQLILLAQLPELREHAEKSQALLKELRRLRRAAGEVRDQDVLRRMLEEFAGPEAEPSAAATAAADAMAGVESAVAARTDEVAPVAAEVESRGKKGKRKAAEAAMPMAEDATVHAEAVLAEGAKKLRAALTKDRDEAAKELQELLKKRQAKTARAGESLLKTLHPVKDLAVGEAELLTHARTLVRRDGYLDKGPIADLNEKQLHSLRKSAKAARYLAETMPESPAAMAVAQEFESVQEAGGQWHDLLQLARAARHELRRTHELVVILAQRRDERLHAYAEALTQMRGEISAKTESKTDAGRRATAGRKTTGRSARGRSAAGREAAKREGVAGTKPGARKPSAESRAVTAARSEGKPDVAGRRRQRSAKAA